MVNRMLISVPGRYLKTFALICQENQIIRQSVASYLGAYVFEVKNEKDIQLLKILIHSNECKMFEDDPCF